MNTQGSINNAEQEKYDLLWKNEWKYLLNVGPGVKTRQRILLRFVRKYLTSGKVIDIGCGDGKFLADLNRHYGQRLTYEAAEISREALEIIDRLGFISNSYLVDITRSETLPASQYDGVIASEVLEHIDDWKLAINNLSGIIKPGGYMFITVPSLMKHLSIHDEFAHHFRRFEIGEIENELARCGFEVKESLCWGWPMYALYYSLLLKKVQPETVMNSSNRFLKNMVSFILYYLFFVDDLFPTRNGRRLFIVGRKK